MSDLTSLEKDQVYRVRGALTSIKRGWPLLYNTSVTTIALLLGGTITIIVANSVLINEDSTITRNSLIAIMVIDIVALFLVLVGLAYFFQDVGVQTSFRTKL